jgi:hypothetical protein
MTTAAKSFLREFNASLTGVEQALALVNTRLVQGSADELEAACQSLQRAVLACPGIRQQGLKSLSLDAKLRARLQIVRLGMAQVRENMARRAAGVQRALQILLPGAPVATYGRAAAAFGSGSKSEASFTSLSA